MSLRRITFEAPGNNKRFTKKHIPISCDKCQFESICKKGLRNHMTFVHREDDTGVKVNDPITEISIQVCKEAENKNHDNITDKIDKDEGMIKLTCMVDVRKMQIQQSTLTFLDVVNVVGRQNSVVIPLLSF